MTNNKEQFIEGEVVLVMNSYNLEWEEHIYLGTSPWNVQHKHIGVHPSWNDAYKRGEKYCITTFTDFKKLEITD